MFVTIFRYGQEIDPGSGLDPKYAPNKNHTILIPDHAKRWQMSPRSTAEDEEDLNVISDLPAKHKQVLVKVKPQGDQEITFVRGKESHSPEDQSNHDEAFLLQQRLKQQSYYAYGNEKESLDWRSRASGFREHSDSSRPDLLSPILIQPQLQQLPAQPSLSLPASSAQSADKSNLLTVDNKSKFNAAAAPAPDESGDHPASTREEASPSLQLLLPLQSLSSSLSLPTSLSSSGEATKKPGSSSSSSSISSLRVSDALLDSLPKLISSLSSLQDTSNNRTSSTSPSVSSTIPQPDDPQRKVTFDAADLESTKEFVINKPNFCDDDNGATNDLLVVVNSAVSHFEAREAIRQTWGQFAVERGSLLLFLLGSVDPSSAEGR